jgi:hypothetical protein
MRNISFALTTDQFRNRTKTVTRRLGWLKLKAGDELMGCVKCMGLKPGEKLEKLGRIRVTNVRREPLGFMETQDAALYPGDLREVLTDNQVNYPKDYGNSEADKEGFPNMTGSEFVRMFCENMKCEPSTEVTRIEFEYLD